MASPNLSKQDYQLYSQWSQPRRTSYKRGTLLIVLAAFFTVALQWSLSSRPSKHAFAETPKLDTPFDFHSIQPSKNLEYHDCYGFKCARLEVPMDWNATDPDKGDQMALAIVKKPASVPVTDPRYGGVILLNPGGPGGSGSNFAFRYAEKIALIVDSKSSPDSTESSSSSDDLYFDILSWDPRGVNLTTPGFYCFQDSLHRKAWAAQGEAIGLDLDDEDIFRDVWSRGRAMSAGCSRLDASGSFNTVNGNEHLGQYVSTASVVRDMVEIIERHGEWREKTAKEILSKSSKNLDVAATLQRTAWRKGEELLQYWGFSYGTFLGQSFASMQPHRVGRLVLDGVVDADDYARVGWSTNLQDMDEITKNFTTECYEAGPSRCSLYDPQGPSHIYQTILSTLEDLKTNPIPTWTPAGPTTISASDVTKKIFGNWYSPMASFRQTASLLADLSRRNGSAFAALKAVDYEQSCTLPSQRKIRSDDTDATMAILCSDGDSLLNKTQQDFKTYISLLQAQAPLLGTSWAIIPLSCYAYTVRAKWRFTGPFGAPTAHPILFASQTFDPVTPLRNAFAAAELFPGSAVVVAEGLGHTTLAQPSVCAMMYVRRYFHRGVLPVSGTRCPVDVGGFGEMVEGEKEGELVDALVEIARTWPWQF